MKWLSSKLLLGASLVWWLSVGWVLVDYNLGWGVTTLRWNNPSHATAAWTWDENEKSPSVLEPQSGQWFRVTLPRGFSTGTLRLVTTRPATIILRGEGRGGVEVLRLGDGKIHKLPVAWVSLVARGRTFRFWVENAGTTSVNIATLDLRLTR